MTSVSGQISVGAIIVAGVVLLIAAGLLVWLFSGKRRDDDP